MALLAVRVKETVVKVACALQSVKDDRAKVPRRASVVDVHQLVLVGV